MQGRLSPIIDNKIQSFPKMTWELEFMLANKINIPLMEWTIDQEDLHLNPLMNIKGRRKIKFLSKKFGIKVVSLTGDCFMQSPFWKKRGYQSLKLKKQFLTILKYSKKIGIKLIVLPLVDNGSLKNKKQVKNLISFLRSIESLLLKNKQMIIFEIDYEPKKLKKFISKLNSKCFGINYDIGNSASNGFSPVDEINEYGKWIKNVHIKDRKLNGGTVPLGSGNANFKKVFLMLNKTNYKGNFILQTARAKDNNHLGILEKYHLQVTKLLKKYGS